MMMLIALLCFAQAATIVTLVLLVRRIAINGFMEDRLRLEALENLADSIQGAVLKNGERIYALEVKVYGASSGTMDEVKHNG